MKCVRGNGSASNIFLAAQQTQTKHAAALSNSPSRGDPPPPAVCRTQTQQKRASTKSIFSLILFFSAEQTEICYFFVESSH
jgi:hypothetical protein